MGGCGCDSVEHESNIVGNRAFNLIVERLSKDRSIFVTEHDFRCSLELFLDLRIGEIDP
jgi:hypothetical protein